MSGINRRSLLAALIPDHLTHPAVGVTVIIRLNVVRAEIARLFEQSRIGLDARGQKEISDPELKNAVGSSGVDAR